MTSQSSHLNMRNEHGIPIRIISHNIRYAAEELSNGEAPWRTRLPLLAAHFRYHTAQCATAFICAQELLYAQLIDLLTLLNSSSESPPVTPGPATAPEWAYIGVGRSDGKTRGEHCAIFYRPSLWQVKSVNTIWLSPHPAQPGSKYPGAGSPRLVTIGHFRSTLPLEPAAEVVVANTHLDNRSEDARVAGAQMVSKLLKTWASERRLPVVLAGDLNSTDSQGGYKELTKQDSPVVDAMSLVQPYARYGEHNTFTGFRAKKKDLKRIDYVFAGPRDPAKNEKEEAPVSVDRTWKVTGYAVLPNRFDDSNGVYHSDHRAVAVDLLLRPAASVPKAPLSQPYSDSVEDQQREQGEAVFPSPGPLCNIANKSDS